jgi:uncharacterized membrane protein
VLITGIALFLGVHSLPMFPQTRRSLIAYLGTGPFKGLYSVIALGGFGLIIFGFSRYRAAGMIPVWTPPEGLRHLTLGLMWLAFVAMACSNPAPGRIRGWLRHPMLVAVKIWALAHLLANGDLGGIILFGSFLAWAVFDRISVKRRRDFGAPRIGAFTGADAIALVVGTIAYGTMIVLHPVVIGVPVIDR